MNVYLLTFGNNTIQDGCHRPLTAENTEVATILLVSHVELKWSVLGAESLFNTDSKGWVMVMF